MDAIRRLAAAGKRLVILSNSSKRRDNSVKMLTKLGFDPLQDFERIVTSGEAAHGLLLGASTDSPPLEKNAIAQWSKIRDVSADNRKAVVLGSGDGDVEYLQGCGWTVDSADEASLVVARGTFTVNDGNSSRVVHKRDDADAYETALQATLQACAARRLPMLVTNPDKVRPDVERPPMPGKIGDAYEAALAQQGVDDPASYVKRIGKPFSDVYDMCLAGVDKTRACMVGDALETDVTGGALAGIATVWVLMDGIHSPDVETLDDASNAVDEFNQNSGNTYAKGKTLQPDFLLAHFRW